MHQSRNTQAKNVRVEAAELASRRPPVKHCNNKEEYEYRDPQDEHMPSHIANFTKGLPHDLETGLILNHVDYKLFINGIQSGDPVDFQKTPLGPGLLKENKEGELVLTRIPENPTEEAITPYVFDRSGCWSSEMAQEHRDSKKFTSDEKGARVRAWESAGAGNVLDLEGPDAQATTMPPAPRLDSDELTAEVVENYCMALMRDIPFSEFPNPGDSRGRSEFVNSLAMFEELAWFKGDHSNRTDAEKSRTRQLSLSNLFRGVTPGETVGPYLSQFMLMGNNALGGGRAAADGYVRYGAIGIQQKVRIATETKDYMSVWEQYVDVQNGADLRGIETYLSEGDEGYEKYADDQGHRFIATPRDLATYVHYDALYEAYLNACLFLIGADAPFDRGIPFLESDTFDKQQGFAHFGGPHILTLVCEVATRALKAVRYQKFNIHRRLRPEAVGGLVDRWMVNERSGNGLNDGIFKPVERLMNGCGKSKGLTALNWSGRKKFLDYICERNAINNRDHHRKEPTYRNDSWLMSMAFPEGSPMHPSYGAGHGTVAGACVTILKAYFDHGWTPKEWFDGDTPIAYTPNADGTALEVNDLSNEGPLTLEGELNKLAANIAIGRNWAGVHYYSDYIESLRLGEEIAIGILEEQKLTYPENFTMTIPLFDGGAIRI